VRALRHDRAAGYGDDWREDRALRYMRSRARLRALPARRWSGWPRGRWSWRYGKLR